MHHALEIQEILLNIFGYFCRFDTSDLISLARTCRTFKEPALDVLWEDLEDLSPLIQCLPCFQSPSQGNSRFSNLLLTQSEWDIILSYTRRIRLVRNFEQRVDEKFLRILSNPPTPAPIFPNLRYLRYEYKSKARSLWHLPLPSLNTLHIFVDCDDPNVARDSLTSFFKFSPDIRTLSIRMKRSDVAFGAFFSNRICHWRNLESVTCPQITLDTDALVHLSHMSALTLLDLSPSATLPTFESPLLFSNLKELILHPQSWDFALCLLSGMQLPAILYFTAIIANRPSIQELSSYFIAVQASSIHCTIKNITFDQWPLFAPHLVVHGQQVPTLGLDHLRPCMVFKNLESITINLQCSASLTDTDLLTLAAAWPHIRYLSINMHSGWNTEEGITLYALVQLLQMCPSLSWIAIAIDSRSYTEPPSSAFLASLGVVLPCWSHINVLDSTLEAESVPAVAALFAGIASCRHFNLRAWDGDWMVRRPGWEGYRDRWAGVCRLVSDAVSRLWSERCL